MTVTTQSVAAVVTPVTSSPRFKMTPPPMNPTPVSLDHGNGSCEGNQDCRSEGGGMAPRTPVQADDGTGDHRQQKTNCYVGPGGI
jgi:hypothetical protein